MTPKSKHRNTQKETPKHPKTSIHARGLVAHVTRRYLPEQLSQWSAHCRATSTSTSTSALTSPSASRSSAGSRLTGVGDGIEAVVEGATASGFSEHWFQGVSPEKGADYWGTPHRIVLDYPRELQAFLAQDLPALYQR